MPQWTTFAGLAGVVTLLLLVLSHATKVSLTEPSAPDPASAPAPSDADGGPVDREADGPSRRDAGARGRNEADAGTIGRSETDETDTEVKADPLGARDSEVDAGRVPRPAVDRSSEGRPARDPTGTTADRAPGLESLSTGELLANVALSQGLFAAVLIAAAIYTEIPPADLGIAVTGEYVVSGVLVGAGAGLGLYVANEVGSAAAERYGFDHDEGLRAALAPDGTGGWLVLLLVVLPLIATFEEFLFRAALIGAIAAGFGISEWALAVVSSIAFALGHGVQGATGVVVTGLLGFALAATFVLTGSLLAVVVAHYLINALEFVVHEGLELEWATAIGADGDRTG